MKKFIIVLGIVVVCFVCISIFKDLIIKSAVTTAASRIIGTPVHMDKFSLDVFRSTIHITGFKMYNPGGFPEGLLVFCPRIKVIYGRGTLFKEKRHLLLVDIELQEMGLTKNKDGILNVDSLKVVKESRSAPPVPMQIDMVTLRIGKIVYKDYTMGTEPGVRVYDVNRHKSYKGIPTAQQLALLVLAEPMKAAAIQNAAIYGVTMLAGVAVLPVAAAATFIGKDYVQQAIFRDVHLRSNPFWR